ncbi:MAG: hypothetical protein KJZ75_11455 [Hyphomonadaceae bacterium]|nr:hypothetical protein [Hyphomonadaceae bacterium]
MSIEEMCAVVDEGKRTVEQQARRIAYLERELRMTQAAREQTFDLYRAARDGLFALQCANTDPQFVRDAADKIDCGNGCAFSSVEWDTGAHNCSRMESAEGCDGYLAQQLYALADAFDVLRKERETKDSDQ